MKTLLTGATGFVGSALLRLLLAEGHEVRALVRPDSDRRNLEGLDLEVREGDLNDIRSLRRALRGCDTLFHVAADYRLWVPQPEAIYQTNVEGTRKLLLSAGEAGIARIIYTSSVATLGINKNRTPADETTPVSVDDMVGHYKRSKYLAEEAVRELIDSHKLPVVIVNPSTPVGPRDIKPTPTGRIIVDMLNRRIPAYVNTGLNIVHVDDVAQGHLLAFEKGRFGERYILGGEDMSLQSMLAQIAGLSGMSAPRICLPHNAVLPVAWLAEFWARIAKREPLATVDGINMARKYMYFSSAKAQQALGYDPGPAAEAIAAAVKWYQENNYC